MWSRFTALFAIAALSISACMQDSNQKPEVKPVPVAKCSAEQVLEPRRCKASCNSGMLSLDCSNYYGAIHISRSSDEGRCRWDSPWRYPQSMWVEIFADNFNRIQTNYDSSAIGKTLSGSSGVELEAGYSCRALSYADVPNLGGGEFFGHCDQFRPLLENLVVKCSRQQDWEMEVKL